MAGLTSFYLELILDENMIIVHVQIETCKQQQQNVVLCVLYDMYTLEQKMIFSWLKDKTNIDYFFQIEGSLPKNIFVREILYLFKVERRAAGILLFKNVVSLFPTFFLQEVRQCHVKVGQSLAHRGKSTLDRTLHYLFPDNVMNYNEINRESEVFVTIE